MASKRGRDEPEEAGAATAADAADDDGDGVGPLPASADDSAQARKKKRVLQYERVYLENMPSASMYEKSYMHRDTLSFVGVSSTDFCVTVSVDGHVKFWKKQRQGIEFVKHFRGHLDAITAMDISPDGSLLATVGRDKALKVFDVVNFDMINMIKLDYVPRACCWIFQRGDAQARLAIAAEDAPEIRVYDGRATENAAIDTVSLHMAPVVAMTFHEGLNMVISADRKGIIEYWDASTFTLPEQQVEFEFKSDTDLYEFAKAKTYPTAIRISSDASARALVRARLAVVPDARARVQLFVAMGMDRQVRLFKLRTGKLYRKYDESIRVAIEMQQAGTAIVSLDDMDFQRRIAIEKEIDKADMFSKCNAIFDESGNFVLYATLLGVKVVNIRTNRVVRVLGRGENIRFLNIALFQSSMSKGLLTIDMAASENPAFVDDKGDADSTLFATAYKAKRFFLLTKREPSDEEKEDATTGRDVFNEKPTREEMTVAVQPKAVTLPSMATIHTSVGDVMLKLFPEFAPLAVENFATHARNGYYNNHIFHRVIKGFMIQTGDPQGDGTGGKSIWGNEFRDEFHRNVRHDRPYTVSMANAGPNTNGSQFFITVVATPWLDNKHTIFARCIAGMDVVHSIEHVRVDKNDKPYDDIRIINIDVKQ